MTGSRSLMDFVDAPLLVGDPDGQVVYVNPAFEREFARSPEDVTGQPLASVFEGGGRESILSSVARVCSGESSVRFHMREAGKGFVVSTSPVEAEGGRVGVIILLTPEGGDERLMAFQRAVRDPLDELNSCLLAISAEAKGGPGKWQILVSDGLRAIERIRKWSESVDLSAR